LIETYVLTICVNDSAKIHISFRFQPAKEFFGDDVPWWIKSKTPLQVSPSAKSINLMKEKFGEDIINLSLPGSPQRAPMSPLAIQNREEEEEEEEEETAVNTTEAEETITEDQARN
jgi:hypothetical protein